MNIHDRLCALHTNGLEADTGCWVSKKEVLRLYDIIRVVFSALVGCIHEDSAS